MKFTTVFLAITALVAPAALACKCKDGNGYNHVGKTEQCCRLAGVGFRIDDCPHNEINNQRGAMNLFRGCCEREGTGSDC